MTDMVASSTATALSSMETFEARLASFVNWPFGDQSRPISMAAAGLYKCFPHRNAVRCFSCQILFDDWRETDQPVYDHFEFSPRCRWIIEIGMATFEERLKTFNRYGFIQDDWQHPTSANLVAAAGLYRSDSDTVTCFSCQCSLQLWEIGRNPLQDHLQVILLGKTCSWIDRAYKPPNRIGRIKTPSKFRMLSARCLRCKRHFRSNGKLHRHLVQRHHQLLLVSTKKPSASEEKR